MVVLLSHSRAQFRRAKFASDRWTISKPAVTLGEAKCEVQSWGHTELQCKMGVAPVAECKRMATTATSGWCRKSDRQLRARCRASAASCLCTTQIVSFTPPMARLVAKQLQMASLNPSS